MDSIKVKNFILIVLLIVNAVFLAVVASDAARERASRKAALEGVIQVLEENGIRVEDSVDLDWRALDVCEVSRDLSAEAAHIGRLLGEASVLDQGGNIVNYKSALGEAVFRGTGGFEILFNEGVVPTGSDAEATARDVARRLGIELLRGEGSADTRVENGAGSVLLYGRYAGARILNCRLSFTFAAGSLNVLSGTRPLDIVTTDAASEALNVPTVLIRFLELVREKGHICSALTELELCYAFSASASGEGRLLPVWRIVTDTGEFYLNALTGREEPIS